MIDLLDIEAEFISGINAVEILCMQCWVKQHLVSWKYRRYLGADSFCVEHHLIIASYRTIARQLEMIVAAFLYTLGNNTTPLTLLKSLVNKHLKSAAN